MFIIVFFQSAVNALRRAIGDPLDKSVLAMGLPLLDHFVIGWRGHALRRLGWSLLA